MRRLTKTRWLLMTKLSTFFEKSKIISKIKSIKHIEVYLVVLLIAVVLIIWFADFGTNANKTTNIAAIDIYNND